MNQTDLHFDTPLPDQLFRRGSQNFQLYSELLKGPVTNEHIVRRMGIFNSTGRVSDIRKKIRPYMMDVCASAIGDGGLYVYNIKGVMR
jgi:hypothetical protein